MQAESLGAGMDEFRAAGFAGDCLRADQQIYQQGLTLFLWLPAMVFAWSAREESVSRRSGASSAGCA